jgi:hypothetical protein
MARGYTVRSSKRRIIASPSSGARAPVGGAGLAFGAREGRPDRRHVVEMKHRHEMDGAAGRADDGPRAHFVAPEPRQLLRERHVRLEIMLLEGGRILRRPVDRYHPSHRVSPCLAVAATTRRTSGAERIGGGKINRR